MTSYKVSDLFPYVYLFKELLETTSLLNYRLNLCFRFFFLTVPKFRFTSILKTYQKTVFRRKEINITACKPILNSGLHSTKPQYPEY